MEMLLFVGNVLSSRHHCFAWAEVDGVGTGYG